MPHAADQPASGNAASESAARDQARLPNFILGGAPKCGTTAMANYLRTHPSVWFSDPKEPFYWATDLPALRQRERMLTEIAYAQLFRRASDEHLAIGEGSTLYLFSEQAIPNILQRVPGMKFIFMIRRPDELAHAYHMQMRFHYFEDVEDFSTAWRLQTARARGEQLPAGCLEPCLLQYHDVARIGSQLQRAHRLIPPKNLLVLSLDELRTDARNAYLRVLKFLDLDDDARQAFPQENASMRPRAAWITQTLRSHAARRMVRKLKSLPLPLERLIKATSRLAIRKPYNRPALPEPFRQELIATFAPEVDLLEQILDRDLSHWRK